MHTYFTATILLPSIILLSLDAYVFLSIKSRFSSWSYQWMVYGGYWCISGGTVIAYAILIRTVAPPEVSWSGGTIVLFGIVLLLVIAKVILFLSLLMEDLVRLARVTVPRLSQDNTDREHATYRNNNVSALTTDEH